MDSLNTVVLSDYKLTGYVDALSQSPEHLATVDLTGVLLQGEPYTIDFSLTDLNGFELDHFATPEFYWASLIVPDFSADILLTALILLTFVIVLLPKKKK